jgi:hypothetical protein
VLRGNGSWAAASQNNFLNIELSSYISENKLLEQDTEFNLWLI